MTGPARSLHLAMGWGAPRRVNRYVEDLRNALVDAGAAVEVVAFDDPADPAAPIRSAGSEGAHIAVRVARHALAAWRSAAGADVLDAHFTLYSWLPTHLGPTRRLPLVAHWHGPWEHESRPGPRRRVKGVLDGQVLRRAGAVVTLSPAFRRLAVERYQAVPWTAEVIPPAVDLARFVPGRDGARRALAVGEGTGLVVCARRLVERMGVDTLLDAWAALPGGGPRQLVVVGDGPEAAALAARAAGDPTVRLVGRVGDDELVRWYQAADVAVVPSRRLEGFGLVVLEAAAAGCPSIVTDVGGLPSAVAGLDPSLVVPPERPDLLAARLAAALAGDRPDPAACRRHAEAFGPGPLADRHLALYRQVAHGGDSGQLRVVYLDHCAELSGGEIALLRLLAGLPDVRAHVILAEEGPLVDALHGIGVTVEVLPLDPAVGSLRRVRAAAPGPQVLARTAAYTARLARRLRRLRPDLVHTNSLKSAVYGTAAGRLAGVPVVWHARDRMADDYLPAPAVRALRQAARRMPAAVIANSAATAATIRTGGAGGAPLHVVPDPYEPPGVTPRARPAGGPLRAVLVGRLATWKGQDVAVEALALPGLEGVELDLVGAALFGEEPFEEQLRARIAELGLGTRVRLLGHRDDVAAVFADHDVALHTSRVPEPFGQVVVEAMAAGLPVVAAAAGGPAEIITDGADGLLVPPGDPAALAGAIRRLAGDPELAAALGAAARCSAERYRPARVGPMVTDVYRQVLGR